MLACTVDFFLETHFFLRITRFTVRANFFAVGSTTLWEFFFLRLGSWVLAHKAYNTIRALAYGIVLSTLYVF